MSDARERLLSLLRDKSFARKKIVLSSGAQSDFFVDCKQTVLLAEGHALVGQLMLDAALQFRTRPVAVAGVELGGCSLASAVALLSFQRGQALDAVYVRKQAKGHGSQRMLEGDAALAQGAPIVVVEDVVTTGGSTLRAVTQLRERGFSVCGVVAIVDRLEGGADALRGADLEFVSLFTRDDFIPRGT